MTRTAQRRADACRESELRCLCWDEIHPGYLRLRDSKTGPRVVPISGQVQLLLGRQRVVSRWVFPGRNPAKPVGKSSVQRAFHEARGHAGLKDGCIHTIRHSFASVAVRNGVPIAALQKIMGHQTASWVTNRYVHMDRRDAATACAVFANALQNAKGGR